MTYRHTQVGTVIIGAVVCMVFITLLVLVPAVGSVSLPALAVLAISGAVLATFSSLTVEIEQNTLTCRFGVRLIRRSIPLSDIDHASAVLNPWFVGWGIRWIPGSYWVWNVSGFRAVELYMKDGTRFRIGTDEPEALAHALELSKRTGA